ncbi:bile acid:sodium symporter family protein [Bordetella sp. FB-8]|uniref:bile acid:sodium symporter family protein n=1 Tax=Bordetella sp. FB-8 TaxID=1159870 RepID=UPI0003633148|nr:bile acid:sodium symporter family protein [Bordetella sp. FB-8]
MQRITRFLPDRFVCLILLTVLLASVLPAHGVGIKISGAAANLAVALLFFLHGARLSRESIVAGLTHWRLHLTIFSATFIMFPILGLLLRPVLEPLVTPDLYAGILFLCCLPSTVQSSIAFTAVARGNVPAAVCSASGSSLLGILLTPLLVGVVITSGSSVHMSFGVIETIMLQLLLPFILGQALRGWIGRWVHRRGAMLKWVDQGSILLVVYTAFSEAVSQGLWHNTPFVSLLGLIGCSLIILVLALLLSNAAGKALGFSLPDRITLLFCGSKKSLATGVPMAQVIFAGQAVGAIVLPLMVFHQIQLMVCAALASRYAKRPESAPEHVHQ